MRVRVLGAPVAGGKNGHVPVRGTAGAILSLLASRPRKNVPYWVIESHCWNSAAPRTAKTAVQVAVHKLRGILEPDRPAGTDARILVTTPEGYRLDLPAAELDAEVFVQQVGNARLLLTEEEWSDAIDRLETALALWRGPPFGEFGDRPELMAETRRLEELRLEAEELLSEAHLWTGRESIPRLQVMANAEPLRERRWRHLMLALYRAGRHAEALRAFTAARSTLADIGLEPSPDLSRLEEQILLHDAALLGGPRRRVTLAAPRPKKTLVGRDTDLTRLMEISRPGFLVTIVGAPGVGKTSLARAFAEMASVPAAVVSLQDVETELPEHVLRAVTGHHGDAAEDDALAALAAALGGSEHLLVLDGIGDRLDEATALIDDLLVRCPSLRIVATSREPAGSAREQVLALEPLPTPGPDARGVEVRDNPAVELFMRGADQRGATVTSLADVAEITRLTAGLPAAIELAAGMVDVLDTAAIAQRLRSRGASGSSGLGAAVRASLESIDAQPRALLGLMSRFRGPLALWEVQLAAQHADLDGDVVDHLEVLVRKSIVHHAGGRYSILAPITSEIAAADDRDTAAGLDDAYRSAVVAIAQTAAQQLRTDAYAGGMDTLGRRNGDIRRVILDAVGRGEAPTAWTLLGALDQYWWAIQARREAIEISDAVVGAGRLGVDAETLTRGLTVAGAAGFSLATMVERIGLLEEAAGLGRELGAGATAALAIAFHAIALEASQRFHPSSLASIAEAIEMAEAAGDAYSRAYAEIAAGIVAASRMDLGNGSRACIRGAAIAESVGCDPLQAFGLMWAGHIAAYANEPDRARLIYEEAIDVASRASLAWVEHSCRIGLAEAVQGTGDSDTALELFRAAAIGLREAGDIRGSAVAGFRAAALEIELGNHDQAERLLAIAIPDLRRHGDGTIQASALVTLAQLDLARGDRERAAAHLSEAEQMLVEAGRPPGPLTIDAMNDLRARLAADT